MTTAPTIAPPLPRADPDDVRTPDVSVVVVAYRSRELVRSCLRSLRAQLGLVTQVIVVDNASGDGTVAMIEREFPEVVLLASPTNDGFAHATNRGLARADGRTVLLLNPDTELRSPDVLRGAVAELDRRPEVGMLGCRLVQRDGSLDHACKRGFPTPASSLAYFTGLARWRPADPRLAHYTAGHLADDEEHVVDAVNGAFMLVRRAALRDVGLLDESFWMYMEDLDWCYRFKQRGWPVLYWPGVEVVHVKGGCSGRHRAFALNRAFHHSMWLYYRKHHAAEHGAFTTAAVRLGIWAKLGISALRAEVGRRRRSGAASIEQRGSDRVLDERTESPELVGGRAAE